MPYLPLAPGPGNTAGGLLATASHWLCPGLRIATWARPPRLTRGAAGVSLSPASRSRQSSPPGLFMGQMGSLIAVAARYANQWHSWFRIAGHVMAHLPMLLAGAGTYLPCWVCSCQGEGPTIICCRSEPNRGGWSGYRFAPGPVCKRVYEVAPLFLRDQGILVYCG